MSVVVGVICPECSEDLECMCVIGADESHSGKTERLYLCRHCLSTWQTMSEVDSDHHCEIKRYFFG